MATTNQNFQMFADETKVLSFTVTNESTGALVDFTGATITFRVKRGSTTLFSKTVGSGISVTGTGTFTVTIATGVTTSMSGNYSFECRATLGDGTVTTMATGTMQVLTTEIP